MLRVFTTKFNKNEKKILICAEFNIILFLKYFYIFVFGYLVAKSRSFQRFTLLLVAQENNNK